jgi:hypothetical protein
MAEIDPTRSSSSFPFTLLPPQPPSTLSHPASTTSAKPHHIHIQVRRLEEDNQLLQRCTHHLPHHPPHRRHQRPLTLIYRYLCSTITALDQPHPSSPPLPETTSDPERLPDTRLISLKAYSSPSPPPLPPPRPPFRLLASCYPHLPASVTLPGRGKEDALSSFAPTSRLWVFKQPH